MTLADLVGDSEDEDYLFRSKDLLQPRKTTNPPRSDPPTTAPIMTDNAVASTSRGGERVEPEVTTKKPRPKPRKKVPTGSINIAPSAPPSDVVSTTTLVPQNAATTTFPESILPAESRPQDIPLTIADRAKSRVRNAKSKPVAQDIIEIPSDEDEDERLLRLSPHRPKQKDVRGTKTRPIPDLPPPSIHPSQESLVTPTSDFQPVLAVSSQLPPSDPPSSTLPLPTSTPESAKKRRRVLDAGHHNESPLNPSRKRKRQDVIMDDEGVGQRHISPPPAIATADQPPPNFFASSSSSLPPPPAPLVQGESRGKKPVKRAQLTDDVPPPQALVPNPPKEKKSRPKPKKKLAAHLEPNEAGQSSSISASTSRLKSKAKEPAYKSAEIINDSDEEAESLALPPPPPPLRHESQSPLSDLSETTDFQAPKPITSPRDRGRLVPEVVITTVPRKRSSSLIRDAEEERGVEKDGASGSPKGKKRQKKAAEEDYLDGLDEVEVSPKKDSRRKGKGKRKAAPKGKGMEKQKPQPRGVADDEEFEGDLVDDVTETSRKAKTKPKTKATTKTKSSKSAKSRIVGPDDEVVVDATMEDTEVVPVDNDQAGDPSTAQQNLRRMETPPPRDSREDQENTPPPPNHVKSKPNATTTPSSVSMKTPAPTSASSFSRLNYGHSLANDEKPMTMAEIIRKANSATGTPSRVKSYSSFAKGSRSALRKIAPLHARRKTPPPLPPKPPPPKKTKKQLELEEKWEEQLEETIEGWAALSSQERELLRKQKRDMEMGYED